MSGNTVLADGNSLSSNASGIQLNTPTSGKSITIQTNSISRFNFGDGSGVQQGTWTPTVHGSTSDPTGTYTSQTGNYTWTNFGTTYGNCECTFEFATTPDAASVGGTGTPYIGTLPFTCGPQDCNILFTQQQFEASGYSRRAQWWATIVAGTNQISIIFDTSTSAAAISDFWETQGYRFAGSFVYQTSV